MVEQERDIADRSLRFAVRIVKLASALPRTSTGVIVARQVVRAGTSVGANVEEAQCAGTKKDFARRMNIACGEARETLYWLKLIREAGLVPAARLCELTQEAHEIVSVLTSIVKRTRAG